LNIYGIPVIHYTCALTYFMELLHKTNIAQESNKILTENKSMYSKLVLQSRSYTNL